MATYEQENNFTYEEVDEVVRDLTQIDQSMENIRRDIAEMKAMMLAARNRPPVPSRSEEEMEKLEKEIVKLRKENQDLKQQLSDLWARFTSFIDKHATAISNKLDAFFTKKKDCKTDSEVNENSAALKF